MVQGATGPLRPSRGARRTWSKAPLVQGAPGARRTWCRAYRAALPAPFSWRATRRPLRRSQRLAWGAPKARRVPSSSLCRASMFSCEHRTSHPRHQVRRHDLGNTPISKTAPHRHQLQSSVHDCSRAQKVGAMRDLGFLCIPGTGLGATVALVRRQDTLVWRSRFTPFV